MKTYRVSFGASHFLLAAAFTLGVSGPAFSYGTIEGSKTGSNVSAHNDLIQLAGGNNQGGGLGNNSFGNPGLGSGGTQGQAGGGPGGGGGGGGNNPGGGG